MEKVRNTRKHLSIIDMNLWEQIDKIMELDEYKKSFNKVIIDALYLGLPELINKLFERVEDDKKSEKLVKKIDGVSEEYFYDIVLLLKEVILNVNINKSILSSLFNSKILDYQKAVVNSENFAKGQYSSTPKHLTDYEVRELRKLWR